MAADKNQDKAPYEQELETPYIHDSYRGSGKLQDKVAIITGGDSGIGRSVALHYAREGAHVVIVFLESAKDAAATERLVQAEDRECLLLQGDIAEAHFCQELVRQAVSRFGRVDVLVNNAGTHENAPSLLDISKEQLFRTFEVNLFSFFYLSKAVLPHFKAGSTIINTASVTAYRGSDHLIDYAASKGAIVSFTRSLAKNLADKNIRVNAIAPGPVWTPLVVASFDADHLSKFGKDTPMGRAGYPYEIAPAYVWLASEESSYITGQVIHINGGDVVNG